MYSLNIVTDTTGAHLLVDQKNATMGKAMELSYNYNFITDIPVGLVTVKCSVIYQQF
jgi:hypothetical protein